MAAMGTVWRCLRARHDASQLCIMWLSSFSVAVVEVECSGDRVLNCLKAYIGLGGHHVPPQQVSAEGRASVLSGPSAYTRESLDLAAPSASQRRKSAPERPAGLAATLAERSPDPRPALGGEGSLNGSRGASPSTFPFSYL